MAVVEDVVEGEPGDDGIDVLHQERAGFGIGGTPRGGEQTRCDDTQDGQADEQGDELVEFSHSDLRIRDVIGIEQELRVGCTPPVSLPSIIHKFSRGAGGSQENMGLKR